MSHNELKTMYHQEDNKVEKNTMKRPRIPRTKGLGKYRN